MPRRHEDWLIQAERDLKAAQDSLAAANYEWSAFQAVQAAEKAAKALLRYHHYEARGHSVVRLLRKAQEFTAVPEERTQAARELDRHYVQSRYPNSFPEGFPGEFYDEETARRCVACARGILSFVEAALQ